MGQLLFLAYCRTIKSNVQHQELYSSRITLCTEKSITAIPRPAPLPVGLSCLMR